MKVVAICLLLSLTGASAFGIKKKKAPMADAAFLVQQKIEMLQKVSVDTFTQSRRLDAHEGGGGLDMAGMMKPECQEACPGVKDMLKTFMEMATAETTTPAPGKEGEAMMKMMQEIMCPHMDAITCMGEQAACKGTRRLDAHEGGDMDPMAMMGCICVCPDLMTMGMGGRRLDAHEDTGDDDASLAAMCANPEGTIGCMTSKPECKVMNDMMAKSMPSGNAMAYVGVACEFKDNDCEKKGDESQCDGGAEAGQVLQGCMSPEMTDKTSCCSAVDTMQGCQGKKCMELGFVMASMSPEPEAAAQLDGMLAISKACPEAGMPQSKDEVTTAMKASEKKISGGGDDADPAEAADGAPVFGMAAGALAFVGMLNF